MFAVVIGVRGKAPLTESTQICCTVLRHGPREWMLPLYLMHMKTSFRINNEATVVVVVVTQSTFLDFGLIDSIVHSSVNDCFSFGVLTKSELCSLGQNRQHNYIRFNQMQMSVSWLAQIYLVL